MNTETWTPEKESRRRRSNRRLVTVVIVVALTLLIGSAWSAGTFDNFLWRVGLNSHPCATNGFGATFCGDDLERYNQRIGN